MKRWLGEVFLQHSGRASRSSTLGPLLWLFSTLVASIFGLAWTKADFWLIACAAVAAGLTLIYILGYFTYFARKDPDLLRSESFSLREMEIQRGMLGDDQAGMKILNQKDPPAELITSDLSVPGLEAGE